MDIESSMMYQFLSVLACLNFLRVHLLSVTPQSILIPSKRGKNGVSPEKMPSSSSNKRVRRDKTTMTQDAIFTTPTAS